ncbi:MAG: hypothetical protein ACQRW7_11420 [Caulobacterales bacterium]|uniref:hypothetical protein n=1 Tax=Glycocaulis sp. TaxID=1969725 RepID=UPI003FA17C6D
MTSPLSALIAKGLTPLETYAWEATERAFPGFAKLVFRLETGVYVLGSPGGVFWLAALTSDRALQGYGDAGGQGYVFAPTAGPFDDRQMMSQTGLMGWDALRRDLLMNGARAA